MPMHEDIPDAFAIAGTQRNSGGLVRLEVAARHIFQQFGPEHLRRLHPQHVLSVEVQRGCNVRRAVLDALIGAIEREQYTERLNGAGNVNGLAAAIRERCFEIEIQ